MNFISKKNILAFAGIFLAFSMAISSCREEPANNPNPNPEPVPTPAPEKVTKAPVFILNEGEEGGETGVLGMIDENGVYTDSIYYKANGHLLGCSAQDLFIRENEIFIITKRGDRNDGFAKLFVAEYPSLKEKKAYKNDDLNSIEYPTHLVANDKYIYIIDWRDIHILDRTSGKTKTIPNTNYVKSAQMLLIDNKVYAFTRNDLLLIEGDAVVKTLPYAKEPEAIAKYGKDKILLLNHDLTELAIIDINTFTITKTFDLSSLDIEKDDKSYVRTYNGKLSVYNDDVFITATYGTSSVYKYNLKTEKGGKLIDLKSISADANVLYGGIAVDSKTGAFYVVSMKDKEYEYKTNSLYYWEKTDNPTKENLKLKIDNTLSFPIGIYPVNNFQ